MTMCRSSALIIGRRLLSGGITCPRQAAAAQREDELAGELEVVEVRRGMLDGVEQAVRPSDRHIADGLETPASKWIR